MTKKKTTYTAKRGLDNDKTQRRFEIGDTVQDGDFPKSVIKSWVERGYLEKDGK